MPNCFLPPVVELGNQIKKLHKFYTFNENNLAALSDSYLWFSPLDAFNDPFEGLVQSTSPHHQ